ncbi:MAG TPA: LysM domain-containing protein, partial [Nocardioidaceae bacterium]|nr:LysM domain-containing protein [Nocardioidaceae bacterium]
MAMPGSPGSGALPTWLRARTTTLGIAALAPLALGLSQGAYVVHPGDTVSEIAAAHHLSATSIVRANHLTYSGDLIYPGEVLRLPHQRPSRSTSRAHHHQHHAHRGHKDLRAHRGHKDHRTHRDHRRHSAHRSHGRHFVWVHVRPGDTVSGIAARHHTRTAA